jgi:hypothetical protein
LGHAAIERAAITHQQLEQFHTAADEPHRPRPTPTANPAVTTTIAPDEEENLPALIPFQSSRVAEAGYDPEHQRLYVRFVKPTNEGGTPWTYEGVPSNVWRNFRRSQSAGKYVNRVLNQYNYHPGHWS